ncbi:lysozyme [Saccharothrix sp. AJ9571]|nr:lysozyme [Saccharothrix sp. AJ9571]
MRRESRDRHSRLHGAVVTVAAGLLLLGSLVPASASTYNDDTGSAPEETVPAFIDGMPVDEYVRTFDHPLGSQIRRVEGDHSTEETKAAAQKEPAIGPGGVQITASVEGIDVSGHQGNVNWQHWWNQGKRFAFVKATEGTGYQNPYFTQQYNGSYNIGMIRGAYHFALPDRSSGTAQADYFVNNGGGWSGDGKTLPGALDIEFNPYGATCYGKSQASMGAWIREFHDRYHARTGRWPVIYTNTNWWNECVGSTQNFGATVPLWVARYSSTVGPLPYGWSFYSFWQYTSTPIDFNRWNGDYAQLQKMATS